MAGKQIIWSARAQKEFNEILEFFVERNGSPTYSLKILNQTQDLMVNLSNNELIGRLTTNRRTRVIPFKEYLIFYEVNNQSIEILSFWDNRQDDSRIKI